jgi:hypothetical protein
LARAFFCSLAYAKALFVRWLKPGLFSAGLSQGVIDIAFGVGLRVLGFVSKALKHPPP